MADKVQADFLTCKICKLPFNQPKSLTCLHTFCKRCLSRHLQKNGRKSSDGAQCMFCPVCTQVCDLPPGGVEGLKDNNLLRNLLDMVKSKSIQNCDLCHEGGETSAATYCCIKCEDFLCDECAKTHKRTRITSDHTVISVGSMMDVCREMHGHEQPAKVNARLLLKFGRHGDVLYYPTAINVNKADDILVSNENHTVSMFSLSGSCKKVLDQSIFFGQEKSCLPNRGVAVTPEGYIAVALRKDLTAQTVAMGAVQSLAGREIGVLTAKVKRPVECRPHGIVITPNNHIVITDVGRNCVCVFDAELQLVKQFGKRGSRGRRQFKEPYYVTATPGSDIVVSDYGNHCVKIFDLKGKPRHVIGRMGKAPGEFLHPMGVCVDRFCNFFVADRDNLRVQMFDSRGLYLATIVTMTCKDGHDIRPLDVTMTTYGHLVVLMKGIEGVDMSEIHLYQYGSSRESLSHAPDSTGQIPRRLPPVPEHEAATPQPDLVTMSANLKAKTAQGRDVKATAADTAALAALYTSATGQKLPPQSKDPASQICTIL